MANKKSTTTPKKKQRQTKYTKLALVCSKELAAKKKALVAAEKRLAKDQQTHQDLLSEVARLDMLDRSLKAINEKTQPPQNIKYVYSYPQWVWNPYYNVPGYTSPGQWTFTTSTFGTLNGGNLTGGYNSGTGIATNAGYSSSPTISCTLANVNSGLTFNNTELLGVNTVATSLNSSGLGSQVLTGGKWVDDPSDGSFVVDLTTHEPYERDEVEEIDLPKVDLVNAYTVL